MTYLQVAFRQQLLKAPLTEIASLEKMNITHHDDFVLPHSSLNPKHNQSEFQ